MSSDNSISNLSPLQRLFLEDGRNSIQPQDPLTKAAYLQGIEDISKRINFTPTSKNLKGRSITLKDDAQRLNAFLLDNPLQITPKTYAHIIGHANPSIKDSQVGGEPLEGSRPELALSLHLSMTQSLLKANQATSSSSSSSSISINASEATDPKYLQQTVDKLNIAQEYTKCPGVAEKRAFLKMQINALAPGNSFFFPQIFMGRKSGHATAWEVSRQSNGLLTIRHYNTGIGINDFHTSEPVNLSENYLHFIELVDVDPSKFTSHVFVTGMNNLEDSSLIQEDNWDEWGEMDIYNGLLLSLGGSISNKKYARAEMKPGQYSGICTMEAIFAAMEKSFASDASMRHYRFLVTLKTTATYFFQEKNTLTNGANAIEKRQLLHEGLQALSARALTASQDGTATEYELGYAKALTEQIANTLEQAEKRAATIRAETSEPVSFAITQNPIEITTTPEYLPIQTLSFEVNLPTAKLPYDPIDTHKFVPNPKTLESYLSQFSRLVHEINHDRKDHCEVSNAIRNIILKIPLNDENFWRDISPEAATRIASILTNLNQEYFWARLHTLGNPEIRAAESDNVLMMLKILALVDKLSQSNPFDMRMPSLYQPIFRSLIFPQERTTTFEFPPSQLPLRASKEWHEQLKELQVYWRGTDVTHSDPFCFDSYPGGCKSDRARVIAKTPDFDWARANKQNISAQEYAGLVPYSVDWDPIDTQSLDIIEATKDFDFLLEWVKNHQALIGQIDPNLVREPYQKQALALFERMDKIPPLHNAFINSFILNFCLTSFKDIGIEHFESLDFTKGITINVKSANKTHWDRGYITSTQRHVEYSAVTYLPFGISAQIMNPKNIFNHEKIVRQENGKEVLNRNVPMRTFPGKMLDDCIVPNFDITDPYTSKEHKAVENPITDIYSLNHRYYIQSLYRMRLDPNLFVRINVTNNVGLPKQDIRDYLYFPKISNEHFRELMSLSSSKELQISQILGYFDTNAYLLTKPDYQRFFRLLITEEDFFESWIQANPQALIQLAELLEKVYHHANTIGDLSAILYITELSDRLQHLFLKEMQRHPAAFVDMPRLNFLPAADIINKMRFQKFTHQQNIQYHVARAAMIGRNAILSEDAAIDLLESLYILKANNLFLPLKNEHNRLRLCRPVIDHNMDLVADLLSLPRKQFPTDIQRLFQGESRNRLLNELSKRILGTTTQESWTSTRESFPWLISTSRTCAINVLDVSIRVSDSSRVSYETQDPLRCLLFGETFDSAVPIGFNAFSLVDSHGNRYIDRHELIPNNNTAPPKKVLYRNFNGQWYQHLAKFELLPETLSLKSLIWHLPETPHAPGELIYVHESSGEIRYRASIRNGAIVSLEKCPRQDPNAPNLLVASNSPALKPFLRIENEGNVLGWSRNEELSSVELPRFNLTFTLVKEKGKAKAYCDQYPGYFIAEGDKQHVPELGNISHYLHLKRIEKDGSTNEMVLFPRHFLAPYKHGSFLPETNPQRENDPSKVQRHFQYKIRNGELLPMTSDEQESIEANLYLALLHLSEKTQFPNFQETESKYTLAKKYLDRAEQQILRQRQGFTEESLELLRKMAEISKITLDSHPDALALQIKVSYMNLRNRLDFTPKENPHEQFIEKIKPLYTTYLEHLSLVDKRLQLSSREELLILKYIKSNADRKQAIDRRYNNRGFLERLSNDLIEYIDGVPLAIPEVLEFRLRQLTHDVGSDGRKLVPLNNKGFVSVRHPNVISPQISTKDFYIVLTEPHNEKFTGVILRNIKSSKYFATYYAIAKRDTPLADAIDFVNKNMRLNLPPDLSSEEFYKELIQAFQLQVASDINKKRNISDETATVLLAAMLNPSAFKMSSKEFESLNLQEKASMEDAYEAKTKILEKYFVDPTNRILSQKTLGIIPQGIFSSGALGLMPSLPWGQPQETSERSLQENERSLYTPPSPDFSFAKSIYLQRVPTTTQNTLQTPILPLEILNEFVRERPIPATGPTPPLFTILPQDKVLRQEFIHAEQRFSEYNASGLGKPRQYDLLAPQQFNVLCNELSQKIDGLGIAVKQREDNLLAKANRLFGDIQKDAERTFELLKGSVKPLSLDELIRAYYQRNIEQLHKRNPALTDQDIKSLFADVEAFLLDATYLQQVSKLFDEAQNVRIALELGYPEKDLQEEVRKFVEAANTKRQYNHKHHPEYLVFEYYTKFFIWKDQIETLDKMNRKERLGTLVELAMGRGKTQIIAALIAWLNADKENLSIYIMPEPLVASVAKELQEQTGLTFDGKIRTLAIRREPITVERLNNLYDTLCKIREEGQILIMTASDLESLFNQWVEIYESAHEKLLNKSLTVEDKHELELKHKGFQTIFNLLIKSGKLTIDEIHQVFDITKAYSSTFGEPQPLHHHIAPAIANLFDTIISCPTLTSQIHWDFLSDSHGMPITEDNYKTHIKANLIEAIVERGIDPQNLDFQEFFKLPQNRQLVKDYLSDDTKAIPQPNRQTSSAISSMPSTAKAIAAYNILKAIPGDSGDMLRNYLASLRETLNMVLPITAGKKPNVHFGLNAEGDLIVPYIDGKPSRNSIFGSSLERLLYTAQYVLEKGVTVDCVAIELDALRADYLKATPAEQGLIVDKFKELTDNQQQFSLTSIKPSDFAAIAEIINSKPKLKLLWAQEKYFPAIMTYPKEIESTAHNIPLMVNKEKGLIGMSGTMHNVASFPKVFLPTELSNTQEKILSILRSKSPPKVVTLPNNAAKDISSIYRYANGRENSIIDAAGILSGKNNEQLARDMLQQLSTQNRIPPIEAVVYYDQDQLKMVTVHSLQPIVYDKKFDVEKIAVLWDLAHTTGSNIPVGQAMTATMFVDKHLTLANLMQAAYRLRGLEKGQSINFMITQDDKLHIQKMLKEYFGETLAPTDDLTLEQLTRYALLNQILREGTNNYRAVKERMKTALQSRLLKIMWNKDTPASKAFDIFHQTRHLFLNEPPEEPWGLWGAPTQQETSTQALENLLKSWKNHPIVKAIQRNPRLYPGINLPQLFHEWESIIRGDTGFMPATVNSSDSYGSIVEKRTELKKEAQINRQDQQQTELSIEQEVPNIHAPIRERIPHSQDIFQRSEGIPTQISLRLPKPNAVRPGTCVTANRMLLSNPHLKDFVGIFDDDLLASINIAQVFRSNTGEKDYRAYSILQKGCNYVEIIQDEATGKVRVKLVDIVDADSIAKQIKENRTTSASSAPKPVRIGLLNLYKSKMICDTESRYPIALNNEQTRARVLELIVQAKFAAGILNYSKEELPILERWIRKVGPQKAFNLMNLILNPKTRSDSRRTLPFSPLGNVFRRFNVKLRML